MIELLLQAERALEMGRVDAAEGLYRQVAEADPRNSIAVVGLARVTLERGDEAGALTLARRALAIDGENAAADRMVVRLEEVLTYRGSPLPVAEAPGPAATPTDREAAEAQEAARPVAPPAPEPAPVLAAPPASASAPEARKRRSLLDRLLRRR